MSYQNTLERDQVCMCPRAIGFNGVGVDVVYNHKDECPFFTDYSTATESEEITREYDTIF